jgi:hypothetical protein
VTKTIVYLDHNFVSNLAKARLGWTRQPSSQHRYGQLIELLTGLVLDDQIICPRSTFHDLEAELDERLEREIRLTTETLARGVKFLHDTEVLNNQVTKALYRWLAKDPPEPFAPWAEAFIDDPQAPVTRELPVIDVKIPMPGSPENVRQVKRRWVEGVRSIRRRRLKRPLAFDIQVRRERSSFVRGRYFLPFLRWRGAAVALIKGVKHDMGAFLATRNIRHLARLYADLTGNERIGLDSQFWSFFLSDEFARVPYVDIFCSLYAGSLVYYPHREPQEGDLYDVPIAATVLPYCDVLATDGHMKDLMVRLQLDKRYGVEIYSARKADLPVFLRRLQALAGVEHVQAGPPRDR